MNRENLQDELSLLMIRASVKGKYALLQVAEKHGLTWMQAITLCLLEPDKSVPMNSLSSYLLCEPSNITGIVEKLVEESFVERKEGVTDRRIKTITLTKNGIAVRHEFLQVALTNRLPNMGAFSEKELQSLIALIDKAMADSRTD